MNLQIRKPLLLASIFLIPILNIQSASADNFYKWTDADGSTHYGREAPSKVHSKQVKVDSYMPESTMSRINAAQISMNTQGNQASDAQKRAAMAVGCQLVRTLIAPAQANRDKLDYAHQAKLLTIENDLRTHCA